mgnify:CR=1 FL=1
MIGWRQGEWVSLPDGAEVSALVPGPSLFETFAVRAGRTRPARMRLSTAGRA